MFSPIDVRSHIFTVYVPNLKRIICSKFDEKEGECKALKQNKKRSNRIITAAELIKVQERKKKTKKNKKNKIKTS